MSKNEDKIIRYRKNGFIIHFEKNNGHLWFYIFRKSVAFIIDIMIYIALLLVFLYVMKSTLLKSFIFTYFLFFLYLIGIIALLKNKTLGMLLAGLEFGIADGDVSTLSKLINRIFMTSIYAVPVLGVILMLSTFLSMILNKGLTPIDLFSKTQTFDKRYHEEVIYIYRQIEKEREG